MCSSIYIYRTFWSQLTMLKNTYSQNVWTMRLLFNKRLCAAAAAAAFCLHIGTMVILLFTDIDSRLTDRTTNLFGNVGEKISAITNRTKTYFSNVLDLDFSCNRARYYFTQPVHFDSQMDTDVLKRCQKESKTTVQDTLNLTSVHDLINLTSIRTKCGYTTALPVSFTIKQPEISWEREQTRKVPNIVHYVNFGSLDFAFLNYMSFRSVNTFVKPWMILVHADILPHGFWWRQALKEIPNIYHVYHKRPTHIQGKMIRWVQHASDILRLQVVLDIGGIYFDTDILALKSFDKFRAFSATMGAETSRAVNNGLIVSEQHSPFICLLQQSYYNYHSNEWSTNGPLGASKLQKAFPNLLHLEPVKTFHHPTFFARRQLVEGHVDWSGNYAMHIWKGGISHMIPSGPEHIYDMDNTLGEVMRYIYHYNNTDHERRR